MPFLKNLHKYRDLFFFLLTALIGFFVTYPYHNFQLHLAQGDHGNNFYCFKQTFDGGLPYRDYWWVYGPLMPYYYSFFYHLFGVTMHSVLIGYITLHFLCGIVFYLSMRVFCAPLISMAGAIFFWVFNLPFEHTYNHVGGILMILGATYAAFLYIKNQKSRYVYFGLACIFVLSLIKLNFGFSTLAAYGVALYLINRVMERPITASQKKIYAVLFFLVPIFVVLIYSFFLSGLPFYAIRQCILFIDTDPNHASPWVSLFIFIKYCLTQCSRQNIFWFGIIFILSAGRFFYLWKRKIFENGDRRHLKAVFLTLGVFCIFNLHEFLVSGVIYRSFWIEPLKIMFLFIVIAFALKHLPPAGRIIVCGLILWMVFNNHLMRWKFLGFAKTYIPHTRVKIFTTNTPEWIKTVFQGSAFLSRRLKKDETFLALPSDQMYYFLTDKSSPTRQTEFGIKIHPAQEKETIDVLEKKKVRYVLLSNRYKNPEVGFGVFGESYCQMLFGYIKEHYKPVVVFGEWDKNPEWFINHGITILERVDGFHDGKK